MIERTPKVFSGLTIPAIVVVVITALRTTSLGLYSALGIEQPPTFMILGSLVLFSAIAWWLEQDSRKRDFKWPVDLGFFLYIAWPFILPYYLFKTRGAKAVLVIGAFLAVCAGSLLAGIAMGVILTTS